MTFPCYAKVANAPKTFQGFWTRKPENAPEVKQVEVTIGFDKPDPKTQWPLDCVGEPLEVTVPNGQVVLFKAEYSPIGSCAPTFTITPAVPDNPISDLLAIVTKVGPLGLDSQPTYYGLPPLKNKVLTINSVCTMEGRKLTQSAKITYQNPPRIVVSAGLLLSPGVKSYGIKTIQTGISSNGVVTTQSSIAVTGSPTMQGIPFSFVNVYLAGSRLVNLNAQLGLGVNPNLSSPKVEFYASPVSIGWHDVYFSPGVHFGQQERLSGGFSVGDVTTLSKAPTTWRYYTGFGFSLSYNLKPLVKGGASK